MEENALSIIDEVRARLTRLLECTAYGQPPRRLRNIEDDMVLIGPATKEHQAITLLRNQIYAEHSRMHKASGIPFGVNPNVSTAHYRCHVMHTVLYEMLSWSVFNTYRDQKTRLNLRFDEQWNMYATPRTDSDEVCSDVTKPVSTIMQHVRVFFRHIRKTRFTRAIWKTPHV